MSDARVRDLAVTEVDRNVAVLAGAGTGKTSLLVERVLHLVLDRDGDLGRIAAMTFTEAAAAEMRGRLERALTFVATRQATGDPTGDVARALERSARLGTLPELLPTRAARALRGLATATIATIHGYCLRLLERHPVEAGVAPAIAVDDGSVGPAQRRGLWRRELSRLATGPDTGARLERLLAVVSVEDLERIFEALLGAGAPRDGCPWPDPERARARVWERARPLVLELREEARARGFKKGVSWLDAAARWEPSRPPLGPVPGSSSVKLSPDLREVARLMEVLAAPHEATLRDSVELLRGGAARARAEMDRSGRLGFDDMLVRARDLLRDRPDVRRLEGNRYDALLVDEFQDTDPLQYEILFFIAEGSGPAAGDAWTLKLRPGKLFLVGDPKQSIYRFRGADITSCARALDLVQAQGGLELGLADSQRSPPAVLEPLDRLLGGFVGPQSGCERLLAAAPAYAALRSARRAGDAVHGEGPRVEVWTVSGSAAERRALEADAIAAAVVENVRVRGVAPGCHAILLRAFTDAGLYARALAERGVPAVQDGGLGLCSRPEVRELAALLRAVSEPRDQVALLAVLRSTFGAVTDREILAYRAAGGAMRIGAEPAVAGHERVVEVIGRIAELSRAVVDLPVGAAVRRVAAAARLLEIHAAAGDGAQRVANLKRIVALAAEREADRVPLHELAADLVGRDGILAREGEPSLADPGIDAVALVTIHGAKGREFDVVFVADMARSERGGDRSASPGMAGDLDPEIGMALALPSGIVSARAALETLWETVHGPAENRRLLYVAVTRARERLVLLAGEKGKSAWTEALAALGYDRAAPPADGARLAGEQVLHRVVGPDLARRELVRPEAPSLVEAGRRFVELRPALRPRRPMGAATGLLQGRPYPESGDIDRPFAFAVGLAVHAVLEIADLSSPAVATPVEAVTRACRDASFRHRVDADAVGAAVESILARFRGGALAGRLSRARVLARELPLLAPGDDPRGPEAVHGIADLVIEEQERIVVIDWKTDAVADEGRLAELVDWYRPQVAWYAGALAGALGREVRAELFFVALDRAVVV